MTNPAQVKPAPVHQTHDRVEREPKVWDCIVRVCQDCIDLKGKECHVPGCVFCFKGMDEAKWLLDKMMICPIIDGERIVLAGKGVDDDPARVSSPQPTTEEVRAKIWDEAIDVVKSEALEDLSIEDALEIMAGRGEPPQGVDSGDVGYQHGIYCALTALQAAKESK